MERINRQYQIDRLARNANMSNRGSYLNEDRRGVIDNLANESKYRVQAETAGALSAAGFQNALGQVNAERNRSLGAGSQFGDFSRLNQSLGAGDVVGLSDIGGAQRGQLQRGMDIGYEDFLREQQYPQEQINWLLGLLSGTPTAQRGGTQTTTSTSQGGNQQFPWMQGIGGLAGLYGAYRDR